MAEQAPVGEEEAKVEQQPKSPESPEKPQRSLQEVQKDLQDTVKLYADIFRGIDKSFDVTRMLTEQMKGSHSDSITQINKNRLSLQEQEDAAMNQMFKLGQELNSHPDAPKDLPDFSKMSPIGIAKKYGHTL